VGAGGGGHAKKKRENQKQLISPTGPITSKQKGASEGEGNQGARETVGFLPLAKLLAQSDTGTPKCGRVQGSKGGRNFPYL